MAKMLVSRPFAMAFGARRKNFLRCQVAKLSYAVPLCPRSRPPLLMSSFKVRRSTELEGPVLSRNFSIRATPDSGSIDSPLMLSMEKKIKEHLNAESVSVKDAYGDFRHVRIDVISSAFEGQSAVNRQRMVYKAIWEELQNTVHAVDQMTTKTPSEAS
ncbi:hypothetical protein RJ639_016012 [Escallonia herrerae]|uniref:BolA-like protein n=1 Tax=Escallonia herrerae TaxID=1293975 RepID=A0AA88VCZ4_9ASTE|nr:hypothetical protein RJ639_016012 [Escallonia herrerae]